MMLLLVMLLTACKSDIITADCIFYREPTAEECMSIKDVNIELFRKCTKNKIDYNNSCKR